MLRILSQINVFAKGLVMLLRPHVLLDWLRRPLLTASNSLALSRWAAAQDKSILNDFYSPKRDYKKRYQLYQYVLEKQQLSDQTIDYLEFGVCGGASFLWWAKNCPQADNRFYGFDTFEGLPESWGHFGKGAMAAGIPQIADTRAKFIKGLFQDTLPGFLAGQSLRPQSRKVIHLDADLFSSTLFALTALAPWLKKGDILLFDEFNVPNHEFMAFRIFCDSYYVKLRLVGAVNNYFQVAMILE